MASLKGRPGGESRHGCAYAEMLARFADAGKNSLSFYATGVILGRIGGAHPAAELG